MNITMNNIFELAIQFGITAFCTIVQNGFEEKVLSRLNKNIAKWFTKTVVKLIILVMVSCILFVLLIYILSTKFQLVQGIDSLSLINIVLPILYVICQSYITKRLLSKAGLTVLAANVVIIIVCFLIAFFVYPQYKCGKFTHNGLSLKYTSQGIEISFITGEAPEGDNAEGGNAKDGNAEGGNAETDDFGNVFPITTVWTFDGIPEPVEIIIKSADKPTVTQNLLPNEKYEVSIETEDKIVIKPNKVTVEPLEQKEHPLVGLATDGVEVGALNVDKISTSDIFSGKQDVYAMFAFNGNNAELLGKHTLVCKLSKETGEGSEVDEFTRFVVYPHEIEFKERKPGEKRGEGYEEFKKLFEFPTIKQMEVYSISLYLDGYLASEPKTIYGIPLAGSKDNPTVRVQYNEGETSEISFEDFIEYVTKRNSSPLKHITLTYDISRPFTDGVRTLEYVSQGIGGTVDSLFEYCPNVAVEYIRSEHYGEGYQTSGLAEFFLDGQMPDIPLNKFLGTAVDGTPNTLYIKTDLGSSHIGFELTIDSSFFNKDEPVGSQSLRISLDKDDSRLSVKVVNNNNNNNVAYKKINPIKKIGIRIKIPQSMQDYLDWNYALLDDGRQASGICRSFMRCENNVRYMYVFTHYTGTFQFINIDKYDNNPKTAFLTNRGVNLTKSDSGVKRGDFLDALMHIEWLGDDSLSVASNEKNFSDLRGTKAFMDKVLVAKALGITNGKEAASGGDINAFGQDELIMRGDMLYMVSRFIEEFEFEISHSALTENSDKNGNENGGVIGYDDTVPCDTEVTYWKEAVASLNNLGLMHYRIEGDSRVAALNEPATYEECVFVLYYLIYAGSIK